MSISQNPQSEIDPFGVRVDMGEVAAELDLDTEDFIAKMLS